MRSITGTLDASGKRWALVADSAAGDLPGQLAVARLVALGANADQITVVSANIDVLHIISTHLRKCTGDAAYDGVIDLCDVCDAHRAVDTVVELASIMRKI